MFYAFGDVLLLFFLAWLLSFALLPLINGLVRLVPRLTAGRRRDRRLPHDRRACCWRSWSQASATLASSINQFIQDAPNLEDQLTNFLTQLQDRLAGFGFQVDLVGQAPQIVANLQHWASELVGPLQSVAVASIGVFGSILILVILSIYIAVDRDEIVAFLYRLVPPGYVTEARLLQTSISKSFGGFLRGQVVMGLFFGLLTAIVNIVFGLPYAAVTTVAAGLLQMIPFFGPFVSWLPPVAVALLLKPDVALPVLIVMGIAWFVTMNVISPRLMSGVRRHPPDRRPRLGRHRRQDRRHRRRDLRHPDRRRPVRVLLPLVRPLPRGRDGGRPGDPTGGRTRGPRGQAATRAGARGRRRRGRGQRRPDRHDGRGRRSPSGPGV